jgi:hypothetical protein
MNPAKHLYILFLKCKMNIRYIKNDRIFVDYWSPWTKKNCFDPVGAEFCDEIRFLKNYVNRKEPQ